MSVCRYHVLVGCYIRPGRRAGCGLGERASGREPNSSSDRVFRYSVMVRRGLRSLLWCKIAGTTKRGGAVRLGFSCVGVGVKNFENLGFRTIFMANLC